MLTNFTGRILKSVDNIGKGLEPVSKCYLMVGAITLLGYNRIEAKHVIAAVLVVFFVCWWDMRKMKSIKF